MRYFLAIAAALAASASCAAAGPRLYFTTGSGLSTAIAHVDADGTNYGTFASPVTSPRGLGFHGPRQELYIAGRTPTDPFTVYRLNADGSNPVKVLSGGGPELSLDVVNDKMYWTTAAQIMRANLDGTGIEPVLTRTDPNWEIDNIAIDGANEYIYWSEQFKLYRSDLAGGNRTLLETVEMIGFKDISVSATDGTFCYTFGGFLDISHFYNGRVDCFGPDRSNRGHVITGSNGVTYGPTHVPYAIAVGDIDNVFWFVDVLEKINPAPPTDDPALFVADVGSTGFLAVDNYVIPEPATDVLLGVGFAIGLLIKMRSSALTK